MGDRVLALSDPGTLLQACDNIASFLCEKKKKKVSHLLLDDNEFSKRKTI